MRDWLKSKNQTTKIQGFDTLIAHGTQLTGTLRIGEGTTVIDADMKGEQINAGLAPKPETMLVLGTKSVIKIDRIEVPNLVVNGTLTVDVINVDTLSLGPKADVTARVIRYQNLMMAAGSILSGELRNRQHSIDAVKATT